MWERTSRHENKREEQRGEISNTRIQEKDETTGHKKRGEETELKIERSHEEKNKKKPENREQKL